MAIVRTLLTSLAVLLLVAQAKSQRVPGFAFGLGVGAGGQPTQRPTQDPQCRYTFHVPTSNGQCVGEAALREDLAKMRDELDHTRLQYVARNSVLQDRLDTLQQQASDYAKQVLTLQTKLHALEQKAGAGAGVGGPTLQQVMDTRDFFTKALHDVEGKVFNLSAAFRQDAVQQSQTAAAMEAQLRSQDAVIRDTVTKISGVERQLQALQSPPFGFTGPTSSGSSGSAMPSQATPQVVQRLQDQLHQMASDLLKYDQQQNSQYTRLQQKTNDLAVTLSNHTLQLNDLGAEASAVLSRLQIAETNTKTDRDALRQFKNAATPKLQQLEKSVNDLSKQTQTLQARVTNVATDSMNTRVNVTSEQQELDNLKISVRLLTLQVRDVLANLTKEDAVLQRLTRDVAGLRGATPNVGSPSTSATPVISGGSGGIPTPALPRVTQRKTTPFPIPTLIPGRK